MTTFTNAETITDDQIAGLARESGEAGDHAMIAICDIALGGDPRPEVCRYISRYDKDRIDAKFATVEAARAECARVIADAEAQRD